MQRRGPVEAEIDEADFVTVELESGAETLEPQGLDHQDAGETETGALGWLNEEETHGGTSAAVWPTNMGESPAADQSPAP